MTARLIAGAFAAAFLCGVGPAGAAGEFSLASVAAPKNLATGGDALIAVDAAAEPQRIALTLNGAATQASVKKAANGQWVARITGLKLGTNVIGAVVGGEEVAAVTVKNFPIAGPVFSGPHQSPFVCTTDTFKLVGVGEPLGKPLDADCSARTRTDYIYRSTDGTFKRLADPAAVPADVASITQGGKTARYILRVESGTINRGIYQILIPHDPARDAPADTWTRPAGWNGRLVYSFGGGYGAGYTQGTTMGEYIGGGLLEDVLLSRGYAMASSTLNVAMTAANDVRAAETMMMVRERFIEAYGPVDSTIGWGASGGAMQQHHIAQNYPGLLDGLLPTAASADAVTRMGMVTDCVLLARVFDRQTGWTEAQKTAVAGFSRWEICTKAWIATGFAPGWIDPTHCDASVPAPLRYDAKTNPKGARCGFHDDMVNILGRDARGFARRPLDNVGVQYGLAAFRSGAISAEQFVSLNEDIGGWDTDAVWMPARTVADPEALRLVYETGRVNGAGGGFADVPAIDLRTYTDNVIDIHDRVRVLATKARMIAAHGDAAGRVSWLFPGKNALAPPAYKSLAIDAMERWLARIAADTAPGAAREKVVRNRPDDVKDGCFDTGGNKTDEEMILGAATTCNKMYPAYGDPRMVAGSPLPGSVIKCALKPIDDADYPAALSAPLMARLERAFPNGVCDFTKPGVFETAQVGTWLAHDGTGRYQPLP